ncbi:MAG: hypothetical protein AVDCRST_MAG68-5252 [uncultured Gemmatimonadetes bacterium]|uniref:Uncharacterized protein n=1 Tax=uncultured Gemmatimonadota bacterium TaxID=203437 RepID=A0A6J4MTV6_9BACT|nr:MAG: hypothetical protein AVDCRST_MAG68-5252 [uncultured Gemmatimonadota bacterium]
MCIDITRNPSVTPKSLSLPGRVEVCFEMNSATNTIVEIIYRAGSGIRILSNGVPVKSVSRTLTFSGTQEVCEFLHLVSADGNGEGVHEIEIEIREPGCPTIRLGGVVVVTANAGV